MLVLPCAALYVSDLCLLLSHVDEVHPKCQGSWYKWCFKRDPAETTLTRNCWLAFIMLVLVTFSGHFFLLACLFSDCGWSRCAVDWKPGFGCSSTKVEFSSFFSDLLQPCRDYPSQPLCVPAGWRTGFMLLVLRGFIFRSQVSNLLHCYKPLMVARNGLVRTLAYFRNLISQLGW